MQELGKFLLMLAFITALIGVILLFANRVHLPFGRLPGDIIIQKKNFTFYFPLTTSIIVSIVLSLIFYLFRR